MPLIWRLGTIWGLLGDSCATPGRTWGASWRFQGLSKGILNIVVVLRRAGASGRSGASLLDLFLRALEAHGASLGLLAPLVDSKGQPPATSAISQQPRRPLQLPAAHSSPNNHNKQRKYDAQPLPTHAQKRFTHTLAHDVADFEKCERAGKPQCVDRGCVRPSHGTMAGWSIRCPQRPPDTTLGHRQCRQIPTRTVDQTPKTKEYGGTPPWSTDPHTICRPRDRPLDGRHWGTQPWSTDPHKICRPRTGPLDGRRWGTQSSSTVPHIICRPTRRCLSTCCRHFTR